MGFWHNPVKEAGGWEAMAAQGMTDEEISIMEKEGYDMSPVRAASSVFFARTGQRRRRLQNSVKPLPFPQT